MRKFPLRDCAFRDAYTKRIGTNQVTIWPEMPDCGVYLVWPCDGVEWIHPDDVSLVESWIPSTRVFRRHSFDGTFYRLQYGDQSVRVKPSMWRRVEDEGLSVGDRVEILSHFQENEPGLGIISEIRFDKASSRILYTVVSRELPLPRAFVASDLVLLTRKPQLREPNEGALRPAQTAAGLNDGILSS